MKKLNTSPISGMQELLPEKQAIFNNLKNKIAEVYHRHGYLDIETPSIERSEILLAKAGGDTEKQIYKVIKTAESADSADQALRFDHTVPLARYVVEHENNLAFPFKVSQIGPNFRGERAQKGRFREFYQCDIDVIGRSNISISYDADVISTLIQTFKSFGLKTPVLARINNRKILTGLLEALDLTTYSVDIYSIIDHSEKVPVEKTTENLAEIGLSEENIKKILAFINLHGERSFVVKNLGNLGIDNSTFTEGVSELDQVLYLLETMGLKDQIIADMKIVRGLDYYTGTVFEFILPEHKSIGSVCGGGRYENLTGYFTDQKFPGVGGSIGLTRLFYVLNEEQLLPEQSANPIDYAIIPISENELDFSFQIADKLRDKGNSVTVVLTDKKLGDKLTYATKLANNGIVIGESEASSNQLQVKDFTTGETTNLNLDA
ncbi:histidine--tRNA ligase [Candidatus Saccharibacteria bacterium]|nr:histidine--tRNA ligase [Candidatus Saccharibacteria bacterium]